MYNLNPKTRKEHLMGKIAGNPNAEEITDLKTREEHFLKDIEEASGGGSGGGLVVTFAASGQDVSADKTYADIVSAVESGTPVFGVLTVDGAVRAQLIFSTFTDSIGAVFHGFDTSVYGDELSVTTVTVAEDGTVSARNMVLTATT